MLKFNTNNLYKLFTHEDHYNVHKICGILCLVHFIYRISLWFSTKNMQFDSSIITPLSLLPHACLSLSSLLIKLPSKRNTNIPLIYPEFRLHSIIFAFRSIIIMLIIWFNNPYLNITRPFIVILTMLLADKSTSYYKNLENGTTTRNMPNELKGKSLIKDFYGLSQLIATAQCIHSTRIDQIFLILIPIQVGALLKTLARKGILTTNGVNFYYIVTLLFPYLYTQTTNVIDVSPLSGIQKHIMTACIMFLRFNYNINKYILWYVVNLAYLFPEMFNYWTFGFLVIFIFKIFNINLKFISIYFMLGILICSNKIY